jgi:hypothetical protein
MRRADGPVPGNAVSGYSSDSLETGYGKMSPKKGRVFPRREHRRGEELSYAMAVGDALRQELGDTHQATKTVMRWTGVSERTVENWFAGTNGPRGEHLLVLVRYSGTSVKR